MFRASNINDSVITASHRASAALSEWARPGKKSNRMEVCMKLIAGAQVKPAKLWRSPPT